VARRATAAYRILPPSTARARKGRTPTPATIRGVGTACIIGTTASAPRVAPARSAAYILPISWPCARTRRMHTALPRKSMGRRMHAVASAAR
jgi:hypothetical protein